MSDRMVWALCLSVLAALCLISAIFGLFEGQVNAVLDVPAGWAKSGSNPILGFFGSIVLILAIAFWAPTASVSPGVFLGLAILLAVAAVYLYFTDKR